MQNFVDEIKSLGWTKIDHLMDDEYIEFAKKSIKKLEGVYKDIQHRAGIYEDAAGTSHHLPFLCPKLVEATFNDNVWYFLELYFSGKFILNSFGSTCLEPDGSTYTQKMHRDARDIHSAKDMLNLIVLLNDSCEENGATKMLEKSHSIDRRPTSLEFEKNAISISGEAGDIIAFNPYTWHSTGENKTSDSRTIITPMVTRPFIKPGADYVRGIGEHKVEIMSERMQQLLGYYSRIPSSLSEFYKPKNQRFYRADQV